MQVNLFDSIKEFIKNTLRSRLFVVVIIMMLFSAILIYRIFYLQIIKGDDYLNNFTLKIENTITLNSTRGNIYDRDGNILAYNELAYNLNIEDSGSYSKLSEKNELLNAEIQMLLAILDKNGDKIDNDFGITLEDDGSYSYNVSGKSLERFIADVYGATAYSKLEYSTKLGYNPANATAVQIMDYLYGDKKYQVSTDYPETDRYRIAIIRYGMSQNGYQKYIATTIASNISEKSVATISENLSDLEGVSIEDDTSRVYVDSKYFSHLIGYTGTISDTEYKKLSAEDDSYTRTDIVGKSGIEQYMDKELQGTKGSETIYVDNLGRIIETKDHKEATPGNDVYLSISKDIQEAAYNLLEQEIAGIVYSKVQNIKEYDSSKASSASDIIIPIYDVYYALINNNIIDTTHFAADDASDNERAVYAAFQTSQSNALSMVSQELNSGTPTIYGDLSKEMQVYMNYVVTMLSSKGILVTNNIDTNDEIYKQWKEDSISVTEYLKHAIDMSDWIDVTKFSSASKYSDSTEIYSELVTYVMDVLSEDTGFAKKVYKYMLKNDTIQGSQLCLILFDQNVLTKDDETYSNLANGSLSAYTFLKQKIKNIEITPAQLALDPCTGSTVITDVKTGELLACVTYPGYDNNKLANTVDAAYYSKLQNDLSLPMYNYATQQKTAPGSTFKIVSSTAGLAEGALSSVDEQINCEGQYMKVDNEPKCWIYPASHGLINVSEAIRHSCNFFFYEVGYRLSSMGTGVYNDSTGISKLATYAKLYGLGDKTGIEIEENTPQIADEYPVMAAIGQSNNSYTTTEIARYVNAVANSGTVYNLTLLKKLTDSEGNVLKTYEPTVKNTIDVLNSTQWDAIHNGMSMVVDDLDCFKGFNIKVAGKTGTAQQVKSRPNHALFVGYAPFEDPQIAIATRIAYGYSSHNAAAAAKEILDYYFNAGSREALLDGQANDIEESSHSVTD